MAAPTSVDGSERNDSLDALFSCLASRDRRRLVGLVSEQSPSASREALATALAARTHGKPREEVTDEERQRATITLRHVHLPKLVDAGLVERDGDAVALADHPALRDPGVLEAIEGDAPADRVGDAPADAESLCVDAESFDADAESFDALFGALADARRRTILDVLGHQFGPIHVETLARELGADERDATESAVPAEDVDRIVVGLRHVDLPRLREAGLIEYDPDEGTVAYRGHPALRVPWTHSVLAPEFRQQLTGESDPDGVGEIQGRERVVSFGQSLCDRADEELFCVFTDTGLLEAGCLTRVRDAARQGVDVYLGTRDPTVREYVEENAPEVVLWEPDADWLTLPATGDRVGRLLLADREAVMLGTLLEESADGAPEERAMIGEGETNTLVVALRQLLAPHLEEIDEDDDGVEVDLPG